MKSLFMMVILMSGFNAMAATPNCDSETTYPEITKAELQKTVDEKSATIFDVNGTTSYQKAHVPGAIDYIATKASFAQNLPTNKEAMVVSYCGGPACTSWKVAAVEACKLGYTNVKHFKAGIKGWTAKN